MHLGMMGENQEHLLWVPKVFASPSSNQRISSRKLNVFTHCAQTNLNITACLVAVINLLMNSTFGPNFMYDQISWFRMFE